jgi:tryptophan 2,3-dioxygenase
MSENQNKYGSVHYTDYLQLKKILDAQHMRSVELAEPAHDEMLFIIIHQVYELWFKEIIHDLSSVMDMFKDNNVDEKNIGTAVHRLNRISEILKLLVQQISVLETLTPLDFLDFRNYLFPASGFQSFQFRKVEVCLGLKSQTRQTYNNSPYASVFSEDQRTELQLLEEGDSMLQLIEKWLERTPFLQWKEFKFLETYKVAVDNMLKKEQLAIRETPFLNDAEKELRLKMLGDTDTYFASVLDEEKHNELLKAGTIKLSYKATLGALFINLYRDEPILQLPFQLLSKLIDIDELLTTWRYRHAQMVLRMIGRKIGTGGSSGFDYLLNTAIKHQIFIDMHNISTLMIPRSELPELPPQLKKQLSFYYSKID